MFTTGGYVAVPVLLAAAPLRIPVVLWDGNVIPGRAVRATARLADALAVSFQATCRALASAAPGRPCYVTGTPIRDVSAIDREAARVRMDVAPGERVLLIFGGSQAVRRFNAAVAEALPRLVERVTVIHVTGDEGYAAALAGREGLPEAVRRRYRPYPFLRDEMLAALAAADLVVGRAGSSTLAEVTALGLPMVVVPVPARGRPPARERGEPGRGRSRPADRGRGVRRRRPARRGEAARRPAGARRDVGRGAVAGPARRGRRRGRARPGRRDRRGLPGRRRASSGWRAGRAHDRGLRRDRDRHRHPAPDRGQDVPRRAARPVHDDARRRPGRPVRDGPQRLRAARPGPLRPRARARARHPRAGQRRGHRRCRDPRAGHPGPGRGLAHRRRALHGRSRRPDGARRDRDAAGRPDRPRVRAGHPGHGRRRRVGQRRRARGRRRRRARVGPRPRRGRHRERGGRGRPRPGLPRQPVQARRGGSGRRARHRRRRHVRA